MAMEKRGKNNVEAILQLQTNPMLALICKDLGTAPRLSLHPTHFTRQHISAHCSA